MKGLFAQLALIMLFISAFCSDSFSNQLQEAIADWEREAESRIWDELVLRQAFEGGKRFGLNALCSHKAFQNVKEMRQSALKALQNGLRFKDRGAELSLYTSILESSASIDINPLNEHEKRLITHASFPKRGISLSGYGITKNREQKDDPALIIAPVAAFTSAQTYHPLQEKRIYSPNKNKTTGCACNLNLRDYANYPKANYYELFLYIWEDSPGRKATSTYNNITPIADRIIILPNIRKAFSKTSFPSFLNNQDQDKKKNLNNKDNYSFPVNSQERDLPPKTTMSLSFFSPWPAEPWANLERGVNIQGGKA